MCIAFVYFRNAFGQPLKEQVHVLFEKTFLCSIHAQGGRLTEGIFVIAKTQGHWVNKQELTRVYSDHI